MVCYSDRMWRRITLAALLLAAGGGLWRSCGGARETAPQPLLPLGFTHRDHGAFNCVVCHHNYTEPKFASWPFQHCIDCHRKTPDLAMTIEQQFHGQCEACHLKMKREKRPGGPVRACHLCHTEEKRPLF